MKPYTRLKAACYSTNLTMAIVGNLPPVLYLTFHEQYGVSYSLLGMLVLLNFVPQLLVDVIFSLLSDRFNIPLTIKTMPVIALGGFFLYAFAPVLFPGAVFVGLVLGTLMFAASCGLAEVLMSPVIASIPAKDPDREMSKLHSVYAWGAVAVILISTLYLLIFGRENWMYLPLIFAIVPLCSFLLFSGAQIPQLDTHQQGTDSASVFKEKNLWLCVFAIFFGGAAECTMSQWSSSYLEQALSIPKVWGDVLGVAFFSLTLGLGRTLYAKYGSRIERVLVAGFTGAVVCYLICALTNLPVLGLAACAFTGFCTSMLWPGNLVVAAKYFPAGGVFIYAMMAAGGDLGASLSPQLVGLVTDLAVKNQQLIDLAADLSMSPEQFGMKLAMFVAMLFPLCGILLAARMLRDSKKR